MRFVLLGAAGFVAPRHLRAIKDLGHELVAVMDPHDSVGVLDSYFPECLYFREFEALDRFVEHEQRGEGIDWLSICSPNYLHEPQIRWGLRMGMNVLCEKPLVLNPENLDAIQALEEETGKRANCVLQLRHHPELQDWLKSGGTLVGPALLVNHAPRGRWYDYSWKGDPKKSGGRLMNIGVHYLDILLKIFGPFPWTGDVRVDITLQGPAERYLRIGEECIDFGGFTDLHTEVYRHALAGNGVGVEECRPALELVRRMDR